MGTDRVSLRPLWTKTAVVLLSVTRTGGVGRSAQRVGEGGGKAIGVRNRLLLITWRDYFLTSGDTDAVLCCARMRIRVPTPRHGCLRFVINGQGTRCRVYHHSSESRLSMEFAVLPRFIRPTAAVLGSTNEQSSQGQQHHIDPADRLTPLVEQGSTGQLIFREILLLLL